MRKAVDKKKKDISDFKEMTNDNSSIVVPFDYKTEIIKNVPSNIKVVAKNDSQAKLINSIKNNQITICRGSAGSGKTYVALAQALSMLRKAGSTYKKIWLVKSVTQLEGEETGFLKGDIKDKFEPYMSSFYLNFEKIIPEAALRNLINKEIIKPSPIAFVRGVTIDDSIVIIDETQNIRMNSLKTLMTRIGSNSKYIILGDTGQIDLKKAEESSLKPAVEMFVNNTDICVVDMSVTDDNVRNPIIPVIISAFEEYEKNLKSKSNVSSTKIGKQ